MSLIPRVIRCGQRAEQAAFVRYVPRVFPEIGFARWCELGGWDHRYRAWALFDGDEIVANVSVQRMRLLIDGEERVGWQLGAVGVVPEWRGRGLQRRLLPLALEGVGSEDLVFLFGNESVLDFYPRFGFRRVEETVYAVDLRLTPEPAACRRLDVGIAKDREILERLARAALPVTERFGARDYGSGVLWYWTNFFRDQVFYDAAHDALLIVAQLGSTLRLCDVVAARRIDLRACLPGVLSRPIQRLEFGFTPEIYWPDARPLRTYDEGFLFVRGKVDLPRAAFKFPLLAQT